MPRLKARIDANQTEIVQALRACGANVLSLAQVGNGVPDLLIWHPHCKYVLIEIKDGSKPKSQRKLTEDQVAFHRRWTGTICIVESVEQALKIIGVTL